MRLPARSSRLRAATLLCVVASALRPSHVVTRPSRVVDRRDVAPLALAGLAAAASRGAARGAATKLPSGLVVEDVVVGGGDYPSATSTITMDFARSAAASAEARDVARDGRPRRPRHGRHRAGPQAILADARVGTTRRVVVPPSLGYGATRFPREDGTAAGAKGSIVPPDATLYYEFKIRSITLSRASASASTSERELVGDERSTGDSRRRAPRPSTTTFFK
ncbi:hypothetical protein JL721_11162 [Aureococcus anophagefferens]|nr:hypothetical protein JL721_11162 [Aureococcus anophagefferens]